MSEIKSISDIFVHYLLGRECNKDILLSFVNAVLEDSDFPLIKSVKILSPFNLQEYTLDKLSILDIKVEDENDRIYNIEIQVVGNETFIHRSLYYWAKNYSSQLGEAIFYDTLKPVTCINILDFTLFDKIKKHHTCFLPIEKDETDFVLTDHFIMHFLELPKYKNNKMKSTLEKWIYFFSEFKKGDEKMEILIKDDDIFKKAKKEYVTFTADDRYRALQEGRLKWKRDQEAILRVAKQDVLNAKQDVLNAKKDVLNAKKEANIENASKMLKEGISIGIIAKVTGIAKRDIKKLLKKD